MVLRTHRRLGRSDGKGVCSYVTHDENLENEKYENSVNPVGTVIAFQMEDTRVRPERGGCTDSWNQ